MMRTYRNRFRLLVAVAVAVAIWHAAGPAGEPLADAPPPPVLAVPVSAGTSKPFEKGEIVIRKPGYKNLETGRFISIDPEKDEATISDADGSNARSLGTKRPKDPKNGRFAILDPDAGKVHVLDPESGTFRSVDPTPPEKTEDPDLVCFTDPFDGQPKVLDWPKGSFTIKSGEKEEEPKGEKEDKSDPEEQKKADGKEETITPPETQEPTTPQDKSDSEEQKKADEKEETITPPEPQEPTTPPEPLTPPEPKPEREKDERPLPHRIPPPSRGNVRDPAGAPGWTKRLDPDFANTRPMEKETVGDDYTKTVEPTRDVPDYFKVGNMVDGFRGIAPRPLNAEQWELNRTDLWARTKDNPGERKLVGFIWPGEAHEADRQERPGHPRMKLALVLDVSGSMNNKVGSTRKIDQAKAAVQSIQPLLSDDDHVGLVAFSDNPRTVCSMTPAVRWQTLAQGMNGLRAQGNTRIDPALKAARDLFGPADANAKGIRHTLLLSDGRSSKFTVPEMVQMFRQAGITVSTVAFGPKADREKLRQLSEGTGGRLYEPGEAVSLARTFQNDVAWALGQKHMTGVRGDRLDRRGNPQGWFWIVPDFREGHYVRHVNHENTEVCHWVGIEVPEAKRHEALRMLEWRLPTPSTPPSGWHAENQILVFKKPGEAPRYVFAYVMPVQSLPIGTTNVELQLWHKPSGTYLAMERHAVQRTEAEAKGTP